MTGRSTLLAAVLVAVTALSGGLSAQTAPVDRTAPETLRRQVERRFDVLPLRDGIALRPRSPVPGVRSIEITAGAIAIDGTPVSGAELRARLADAADVVLQVSYLDAANVRAIFGSAAPVAPVTAVPAPPGAAADLPPAPPGRRERSDRVGRRGNDRVRFGESITIDAEEVVDGDVVVIGGSARVDGTVRGDLVAVGGSIDLGPSATVEGDVTSVGGSIRQADGSRIDGRVREVGVRGVTADWMGQPRNWFRWWATEPIGSAFALVGTLLRGAVMALLAGLVVLLAGPYVDRVGTRAANAPFKAGAIGLLAQVLFLPLLVITILVLVITLVGIPLLLLLPFVLLGLAVFGLAGFAAVAGRVGRKVADQFGWAGPSVYATTTAGIAAILLPLVVARFALATGGLGVSFLWYSLAFAGTAIEYLAWTVGFGAIVLTRFQPKDEVPTRPSVSA